MPKDKYSTVIDFGSYELRLAVFNEEFIKIIFSIKKNIAKNNHHEYFESINLLIKKQKIKFLLILKI